jgi:hypothetical protein
MGQVGNEWSVAGIAADPPGGSTPANAQLVQAMAANTPAAARLTLARPSPKRHRNPQPWAQSLRHLV